MNDDARDETSGSTVVCPYCGALLRGVKVAENQKIKCSQCQGKFALTLAKAARGSKPGTQTSVPPTRKITQTNIPQIAPNPSQGFDLPADAPAASAAPSAPKGLVPPAIALADAAKSLRNALDVAANSATKARFNFSTLKPFSWASRNSPDSVPDAPGQRFKVQSRFESTPAEVMAICCCDGRYIKATEEFLHSQGVGRHDLIAVPGGPALLTLQSSSTCEYMAATHALEFMAQLHKSKQVVLIAHQDCAYYRERYQECDEVRQRTDLRRAHKQLSSKHPDIKVLLYYARPPSEADGIGVIFEEILT